jgi:hypothetical protein
MIFLTGVPRDTPLLAAHVDPELEPNGVVSGVTV